jgi:lipooligosaccharide transport system permease protein
MSATVHPRWHGSRMLRITPWLPTDLRAPQRMLERHATAYRRQWMIVFSGFFEPLFYLLSMRSGVGDLVGAVSFGGRQVPYEVFVAPALMASSAMNGAVFDSTGNVFGRLKHMRLYDAVLATPMSPVDVAFGEIGWALLRGQVYAVSFVVVMFALGLTESWWVLMAVPVCALIGLCFAALGFVSATFMRGWADVELVPVVTLPMFLFSATFFPVSSYGQWGWLVQLSPLYHGVALVRDANAGVWSSGDLGHVIVLVVISIAALMVASRRLDILLRK